MSASFLPLDFYPGSALVSDYLAGGHSRAFFHYAPNERGLSERLEHLQSDTVYISCGHQACLLGGPLYVAYKILTAVNLARLVQARFNVKARALFWLAADDDDIPEIDHALSPFGPGFRYKADGKIAAGLLPSPLGALEGLPKIKAENWGDYHKKLLETLFAKYDVTVYSPLDKSTQALRAPFFTAFEPLSFDLAAKLMAQNEALKKLGFKPQVPVHEGDRFLYVLKSFQRHRLDKGNTLAQGIPLTSALSRLTSLEYALPILADISGPAETAYHAQTAPLYEALGRRMPVIWPRFSATVVREQDESALRDFDLTPENIIKNRHAAETKAALQALPAQGKRALDRLDSGIQELFDQAREALVPLDKSLAGAVDSGRRKALSIKGYLEKKMAASAKRGLFAEPGSLKENFDFIFPGMLQERFYNFIFFTDQFPGFLDSVAEQVNPASFTHTLIRI